MRGLLNGQDPIELLKKTEVDGFKDVDRAVQVEAAKIRQYFLTFKIGKYEPRIPRLTCLFSRYENEKVSKGLGEVQKEAFRKCEKRRAMTRFQFTF